MSTTTNVLRAVAIVGLLYVIALNLGIAPFSITEENAKAKHYIIDDNLATPGYAMGADVLRFGIPEYSCSVPTNTKGIFDSLDCWKVSVNGDKVPLASSLKRQGYELRNVKASAKTFCEMGECDFISNSDWRLEYDVLIPHDSVVAGLTAPLTATPGVLTGFTSATKTNLPSGTSGGLAITVRERFLQQENTFTAQGILGQDIAFSYNFTRIGEHTITAQPFVTVYDYSKGFTTQDTGLCSFDVKRNQKYCVQTTRVPVGDPVSQKVYVHPATCDSAKQCGGTFDCINHTCALNVEGNRNLFDYLNLYFKEILAFFGVF